MQPGRATNKEGDMEGCIGTPHWDACESCEHYRDEGCGYVNNGNVSLSLHELGDWIICDDYEKIEGYND